MTLSSKLLNAYENACGILNYSGDRFIDPKDHNLSLLLIVSQEILCQRIITPLSWQGEAEPACGHFRD